MASIVQVHIRYANGSGSVHPFPTYFDASNFARNHVSYTGGKVTRVMIDNEAVWDRSWTDESKAAGLRCRT